MAVLQKLRTKFGLAISIIVGLGLLSFIIDPSQIESAVNSMSSKNDVGKIGKKRISYMDFQEDINKYTTINELMTGSSVQNEETQKQIRDAAWQELLDKFMFIDYAKDAGISVGEAEMVSLMSGDNLSPLISQNTAFMDENGEFSIENLLAFKDQMEADQTGQLRIYWNYLQNAIYTQEFYAKYGALFTEGNFANKLQIADDVKAGNTTADIEYVMEMYPFVNDTTITVSEKEIKDYYNNHKNSFKQIANRDMEYVVYEVVPSESDIFATEESMEAVYDEFASTDNMKAFLLKNSERSFSDYWYKSGELQTINYELDGQIFGGADVTPIITSGTSFFAGRVLENKMIPDSVFVKHILLQGTDAASKADSLLNVLNHGGNFANLAASYSADQSSAADGVIGSIGWMTQTYMIPGFESVITSPVGKPFILNTQYGTHVVLVSQATKPVAKKQVAILEKTALASKETFNKYYSDANTFATLTGGTYKGYLKALDSLHVYSHSLNINEATDTYGTISQAKEVTRWVFDNKEGKASNIITVNNNYFFIATVKGIHKEGFATVQEVTPTIKIRLYNDKLQEKTKATVAEQIAGLTDLEAVAEKLSSQVQKSTAVSFSTLGSYSLDPAVVGAASAVEEGVVSGPVAGTMGVYVFKVSDRQTGEFYTEDDARNLALQKAQYMSQLITPVMMENADVKDNRARFF